MRKLLAGLALCLAASWAFSGNSIRLNSRMFSILVTEPDGWALDLETASQIAHFALYEPGSSWRRGDPVIFGRFVPREGEEEVDEFVRDDEDRFRLQCPGVRVGRLEFDLQTPYSFTVRTYECPGASSEWVAIAPVPSSFAIFVFSARRAELLEARRGAFEEVLQGFRWLVRAEPRRYPPEEIPSPGVPGRH